MKDYRLKIFSDFDGTITKNDVWVNSIGKFVTAKQEFDNLCTAFYSQEINARECNSRQLELAEHFSLDKLNEYLNSEEIDEYFVDFLDYCRENGYEFKVVSGGLDYYIKYILERKNIDIDVYGCKMILNESKQTIDCEYVYTDEYCKLCETCKRNILINGTNDLENEISVFIGDGVSDFCVSGFADIVFAKGRLASYCWKNNITYYEYQNFSDIKNKLISLTNKNKIKQRQEAKIRRRDVIMGG